MHDSSPDIGSYGNVSQEDDFFCFGTCGADKSGANAEMDMYLTSLTDTSRSFGHWLKFQLLLRSSWNITQLCHQVSQLSGFLALKVKFIYQGAID
jgi:hypothetical protein